MSNTYYNDCIAIRRVGVSGSNSFLFYEQKNNILHAELRHAWPQGPVLTFTKNPKDKLDDRIYLDARFITRTDFYGRCDAINRLAQILAIWDVTYIAEVRELIKKLPISKEEEKIVFKLLCKNVKKQPKNAGRHLKMRAKTRKNKL